MSFNEAKNILQIIVNQYISFKEKQAIQYFINLANKLNPEKIREIMTSGVVSNPPLNNEQMINLKANDICNYLTESES